MPGLTRELVKRAGRGLDLLRPPPFGTTLLIYHRVGGSNASQVDLPADLFASQVDELADAHRVQSLGDSLDRLVGPVSHGGEVGPSVVVTFDDGTADFVDVALPILVDRGVPATLYLATGFVDRPGSPPFGGRSISWSALSDALSTGLVTIGSHTDDHLVLDRVSGEEAARDLDASIDAIGEHLGVAAEHFAYPKAVLGNAEVQREVERRFRSAALAGSRPNVAGGTDAHRLSRTPVQVSDGMRWFRHKAAGGLGLEGRVREAVDRVRYRSARQ